uniref:Transposable element Tcb2 transposase n=1 Tax=Magallana gigas TaxID=29159 RepID=K1QTA7_MAGGI
MGLLTRTMWYPRVDAYEMIPVNSPAVLIYLRILLALVETMTAKNRIDFKSLDRKKLLQLEDQLRRETNASTDECFYDTDCGENAVCDTSDTDTDSVCVCKPGFFDNRPTITALSDGCPAEGSTTTEKSRRNLILVYGALTIPLLFLVPAALASDESLRVIPLYVELFYVQFFTLCTCGPAAVLHIFFTNIFHVSSLSPQIRVLFSDESHLSLNFADGRTRVWRRRGERFAGCCVTEVDRFGGGSAMVWGGICGGNRTRFVAVNGTLTSQRYRDEILSPVVLPYLRTNGAGLTFQQDNATAHTARATREFLNQNNVDMLDWPSNSPDLSPLEHVWDELGRRVRMRRPQLRISCNWQQH